MASRAPRSEVIVHRDTPLSRLAAVVALGVALGAYVSAFLTTRLVRSPRDPGRSEDPALAVPMRRAARTKPSARDRGERREPNSIVRRIDALQQRRPVLAFPLAVAKKFGDDSAGNLAALIAYYGFLSLFPLLLALTTVLGTVLQGRPELQDRVLNSALAQFPVIGDQIRSNVHSLHGSALALAVGVAGALWGGMGVMKAAGKAMDDIWEVPMRQRPNFLRALARAALLLAVLGGGIVATTVLSGLGTSGTSVFLPLKIAGFAAAAVVDVALFLLGFRVLTVRDIGLRDLVPGAAVAGGGWLVLQSLGGYYLTHQVSHATQTYGMFAVVIGLLSWLYLQAQLTLLAAEMNVVRLARLWPRSLGTELTPADKRAYAAYAEVEERRPEEDVGVGFSDGDRRRNTVGHDRQDVHDDAFGERPTAAGCQSDGPGPACTSG